MRSRTNRLLRWTITVLVAIAAGYGLLGAPVAAAQGTDGLRVSSSTTYTPEPENERVVVAASYTMTNQQPDEVVGETVRSFFYTKWIIAMPANVTNFEARSNGVALTTSIEDDPATEDVVFGSIALPFNLNFQQSVTLDVTYLIPGSEPRAEGAVARVNDSFLSFSVWAAGDPGQAAVRVNIPDGFEMDLQGDLDELRLATRDGETFLEALAISEPQDFFGQVFGRNDSGLLTETVELPDGVATVRAWPDDPDWVEFVVDAIEDDVPIIEELTGLDWPAGDIEVIETVTPYLYGYGGWFNATSGVIEVGENLERELILHELGHAWFNDELIEGRWITEGLAEEFASRAIEASGDPRPDPDLPDPDNELRVPLAEWASPWTLAEEDAFAYEQYHYNASWWVIRQITSEIGLTDFAAVLHALDTEQLAYPGDEEASEPETAEQPIRWIHLFDLLDTQTDVTGLDELFAGYVLGNDDALRLPLRRETLDAYEALAEQLDEWARPVVVRRELSTWRFDDAQDRIAQSEEIVGVRDEVDELADELALTISHDAELLYETALSDQDLEQVLLMEQELEQEMQRVQTLRTQADASANEISTNVEFTAMTYDEAVIEATNAIDGINRLTDLRSLVDARASELRLRPPLWPASPGATDFQAAAALAEARLATLAAIDETTEIVDSPRSFTQSVGLWRADPTGEIEDARDAFEADALDDALDSTGRAEKLMTASAQTGRSRLIWLAVLMTALLLTTGVFTYTRRSPADPPPRALEA